MRWFLSFLKRLACVAVAVLLLFWCLQFGLAYNRGATARSVEEGKESPTTAVTIADVMAADIEEPVRSRVSFPAFSYKDAFPGSTDKPEYVIEKFGESPLIAKRTKLPQTDKDWLPPVTERLPRNPAVVKGCDGIGRYGGKWRQCTSSAGHLGTKVGYETFIRFGPKGRKQPGLAYKWTVEKGNRVFTFYLRKGQKWSDGKPFGAHDIAWMCNVDIGSAHWANPPNWMQPTDGSILLYAEDILDWGKFLQRIGREGAAAEPSAGKQVWSLASDTLKKLISEGKHSNPAVRRETIVELNLVLQKREFYLPAAFAGLDLASEKKALLGKGASRLSLKEFERLNLLELRDAYLAGYKDLDVKKVSSFNILMFRAAFSGLVAKAEKTRVLVETVPDEKGDDSHILRFTFRKPSSFFLEKTATFMFYRGLFATPRHLVEPNHVDGSRKLEVIDILDWTAFAKTADETGTAAARIFAGMPQNMRARLKDVKDGDKQAIVDALNVELRKPEYFQKTLWDKVDLDAELSALTSKGFVKVYTTMADCARWNQLLVRSDLLARVTNGGVSKLSPDELYQFNLAMFRAAYSKDVVGFNREASLNHAAQTGTPSFDTWVTKMRGMSRYFLENDRHYPVVTAWRTVTPPGKRVIEAVRNAYYYRVDTAGNQLPYLDKVIFEIAADANVRTFKLRSGTVDFQTRNIEFKDYTVLKLNEKEGKYQVRLWANDYCGELTFYFLQAHKNPLYRELQADPRFRYAMSSALNRQEMIDVVWKGLGTPAQWSVPEGSPYYNARHARAYVKYDPELANKLLDEMGLNKRAVDGTRLFPDGKTPIIMDVNTVPERPLTAVRMACSYWQAIGINCRMKVRQRSKINRMIGDGTLDIGVHKEGGNYFGPVLAGGFAPTHPAECPQWGKWVTWFYSNGQAGIEPPPYMKEIASMWENVIYAESEKEKLASWQALSDKIAVQLPIIGIMTSPGQPVLIKDGFKNVPPISMSGWIAHQPGNCCPEVFFKEKDE